MRIRNEGMDKPTPSFKWEDLDRARKETGLDVEDQCPEDSFTAAEYRERYGLSPSTAWFQLNRLIAEGKLRCGKKWTTNGRGHRQIVKCFWVP